MTISELHKRFGTQKKCIAHLEKLRWDKKTKCVHCKSDKVYRRKNTYKWHCNSCNKDFNDWEYSNTKKCDLCGSTDIIKVFKEIHYCFNETRI